MKRFLGAAVASADLAAANRAISKDAARLAPDDLKPLPAAGASGCSLIALGRPEKWVRQKYVDEDGSIAVRPVAATIDPRYVVLFDEGGRLVGALPALCPHREAPLASNAKIEDGLLTCRHPGYAWCPSASICRLVSEGNTGSAKDIPVLETTQEPDGSYWLTLEEEPE